MRVILSEASGRLKALYGDVQKPIASYLEHRAEDIEKQESILFKIFDKRPSTHFAENYRAETEMDEMKPVGENGAYPSTGYQEGYDKTITNVTYKNSFAVSREMMDDNVMTALGKRPDKLLRSYYRGRARDMAAMIGNALQGNTTYSRNDWKFSTVCADGKCQFATDHKPAVSGAKQSNLYAADFSLDNLFAGITAMQNLKDDNGNTLNLAPTGIMIPNLPGLKMDVITAIASLKQAGNANNDMNPLFGNLNIYISPYLNDFIAAGSKPWILIDEHYKENGDCAIYQERVELEVRSEMGNHDENQWLAYARYGLGFVDFRGLMAFGVPGGSVL